MRKIGVSVKNQMIGVPVKMIIREILVRVTVNVIKHVKLTKIQIIKTSHVKKRLFGKLVLACEDEKPHLMIKK